MDFLFTNSNAWPCFFGRFPFIACEIFACEIDAIFKTLVEDEEVGCLLPELVDACFWIFMLGSLVFMYAIDILDLLLGWIFHDVLFK